MCVCEPLHALQGQCVLLHFWTQTQIGCCVSFPLVHNKLSQRYPLKTTPTYYLTVSMSWEYRHSSVGFSAQDFTTRQSRWDWDYGLLRDSGSSTKFTWFGQTLFLAAVELLVACFFKASRRENLSPLALLLKDLPDSVSPT